MTAMDQIDIIASQLAKLLCDFAFLGGSVLGVLITDPASPPVRTTKDVDVLVDTPTRKSYTKLEAQMRKLGFKNDMTEGAPICRWRFGEIVVDLMPPAKEVLGWKSLWLSEALSTAVALDSERPLVKFVLAPYYLATKIEAFHGRGNNDFMGSQDIEDIVAVVNGRESLIEEIGRMSTALRRYLGREFSRFLNDHRFVDSLDGHLGFQSHEQSRQATVMTRFRKIAAFADKE